MDNDGDDRFDPDQPPPPSGYQRRTRAYETGLAACRAILRAHGAPEHGPYWRDPDEDRKTR